MKRLTPKEIREQIEHEDIAGVNTTLQELICAQDQNKDVEVVMFDNGEVVVRDKN